MATVRKPRGCAFWLVWLLASAAGWAIFGFGLGVSIELPYLPAATPGGVSFLLGAVIGLTVLSVGQAIAFRGHMADPKRWAIATFSGGILGLVVAAGVFLGTPRIYGDLLLYLAVLIVGPAIPGAVQWFSSPRPMSRKSGLPYVAVNTVGWGLGMLECGVTWFVFAFGSYAEIHFNRVTVESVIVNGLVVGCGGVIAGAISGAITGAALRWLLDEERGVQAAVAANAAQAE